MMQDVIRINKGQIVNIKEVIKLQAIFQDLDPDEGMLLEEKSLVHYNSL